jgi:branched-chain amino acid transport system permease protein
MVTSQLFQQIISGIAIGSIYALIALSFSLTVRALNVIHFAQGEFFMLGAFGAITCYMLMGLPFWLTVIITTVTISALGIALQWTFYNKLWKSHHVFLLMSTQGTAFALANGAMLIWGTDAWRFPKIFSENVFQVLGVVIPEEVLWIGFFAILIMIAFNIFLYKTKYGMGFRAAAQDRETAQLMGVNLAVADSFVFGASAGLGAIGGLLIAPILFITPYIGPIFTIKGFTAAILGGLGSIQGAIFGGFLLGIIENMVTFWISSTYKDAIVFLILILILLIKPSGLLQKKTIEKV